MPYVARFDGIQIDFYTDDHSPPHFHAYFGEFVAQVDLEGLTVLRGSLPPAKLRAVLDWPAPRRQLLVQAWLETQAKRKPGKSHE